MLNFLSGNKTYLVMLGGILTAAGGVLSGTLTPADAILLVINSLGLGGLRSAINKV